MLARKASWLPLIALSFYLVRKPQEGVDPPNVCFKPLSVWRGLQRPAESPVVDHLVGSFNVEKYVSFLTRLLTARNDLLAFSNRF